MTPEKQRAVLSKLIKDHAVKLSDEMDESLEDIAHTMVAFPGTVSEYVSNSTGLIVTPRDVEQWGAEFLSNHD